MTALPPTVSEAQVEAAAKALFGINGAAVPKSECARLARLALAAAEQVGEEKTVPAAVRARDELGPPLPQMVANRRAQLEAERSAPAPLGRADDVLIPKELLNETVKRIGLFANTVASGDSGWVQFPVSDCHRLGDVLDRFNELLAAAPSPPVQSGEGKIGELYYDIQNQLRQFMANDTDLMAAMSTIYPTIEAKIATLTQALAEADKVIERMRLSLIRIRDFPYVGVKASHAIVSIARDGLGDLEQ